MRRGLKSAKPRRALRRGFVVSDVRGVLRPRHHELVFHLAEPHDSDGEENLHQDDPADECEVVFLNVEHALDGSAAYVVDEV